MKCLSCGEIAADSAKFCENCGTKLTYETTEVSPVTEIPETKVAALPNEEPISALPRDYTGIKPPFFSVSCASSFQYFIYTTSSHVWHLYSTL